MDELQLRFGVLRVPLIAAPMFLVSDPRLVIAECLAGIVGTFPALNARPAAQLHLWITEIKAAIGVNLIAHKTNIRLGEDLSCCCEHRVPFIITSIGERRRSFATSTLMAVWCFMM